MKREKVAVVGERSWEMTWTDAHTHLGEWRTWRGLLIYAQVDGEILAIQQLLVLQGEGR